MAKYRKKPVVIDAFRLGSKNIGDFKSWVSSFGDDFKEWFDFIGQLPYGEYLKVKTLEGTSYNVEPGEWIIRGIKGEYYPCKSDIFEMTYEPV